MPNESPDTLSVDNKGRVPGYGPVHAFVRGFPDNPAAQADPAATRLHQRLLDKALVCNDTAIDVLARDPRSLHIRFEQGGDILFNMVIARVILYNGWEDADYLSRAVEPDSLKGFRALCAEDRFRPEAVAERITLEEDDPHDLAATIQRYAKLISKPGADGERPRPARAPAGGSASASRACWPSSPESQSRAWRTCRPS